MAKLLQIDLGHIGLGVVFGIQMAFFFAWSLW